MVPLTSMITLIQPTSIYQDSKAVMQVRLTNSSDEDFLFPIGRDAGILQNGNSGRREFSLEALVATTDGSAANPSMSAGFVALTYGAKNIGGSLLDLRPGDSVLLKFFISLQSVLGTTPKPALYRICVAGMEQYIKDSVFEVREQSERLLSENAVELRVSQ